MARNSNSSALYVCGLAVPSVVPERGVPDQVAPTPRLMVRRGRVAGISAGRDSVILLVEGKRLQCSASKATIDRALELRGCEIVARVLEGETRRLVRIDEAGAPVGGSFAQRLAYITSRWREVLAELAK